METATNSIQYLGNWIPFVFDQVSMLSNNY